MTRRNRPPSTSLLARFLCNREGGAAPLLAIAALPLVGAVGAAIDFTKASAVRTQLQAALDATVLAQSRDFHTIPTSERQTRAADYFNAQFKHPDGLTAALSMSGSSTSDSLVSMNASTTYSARFMGIVGISTLAITARASAITYADGLGCILALDRHMSGAVTGQGNTNAVLKDCSLYANSDSTSAVSAGGSARIEANSVYAVGGVSGESNITTVHGIRTGSAVIGDPYADMLLPAFSTCDHNNFKANKDATIQPGVYCGGIGINAGATLNLSPGIYFLDGGNFSVNGGGTVIGAGVTLVFTSQNRNGYADATINGNANIWLTAPTSGPTKGVVVFGDRNMPEGTVFKFNGGVTQYFGGAIYVPKGNAEFSGGAGTSTSCTQLIARRVVFTGNSAFTLNCESQGTRPFSLIVTKLIS